MKMTTLTVTVTIDNDGECGKKDFYNERYVVVLHM